MPCGPQKVISVTASAKARLRQKICRLNTMVQQNRVVGRSLNRHDAIVDKEIADVVRAFVDDRLKDLAVTVIEALDMLPNTELIDGMENAYAIGDCENPFNIAYAIATGNLAARKI